jgi:hypothetical protein
MENAPKSLGSMRLRDNFDQDANATFLPNNLGIPVGVY